MRNIWGLFGLLLTMGLSGQSHEKFGMQDKDLPKGLELGAEVPDFTLSQTNGEGFNLAKALEEGPVVIYFYRGNWCPYCSRQLSNLSDSLSQILETGAKVVAIAPESSENQKETESEVSEEIIFLSDKGGEVMKAYDVAFFVTEAYQKKILRAKGIDLAEFNEQEEVVFPVPATYVISKEGKIVYRYFDENYKKRSSVNAVLKHLNKL